MNIVFPAWLNTGAKALAIAGAVGIVLMSGREKKNPALRLALGAYDLYNVSGWLSDVLSYSRLLALGLATGVIASVINQMGSMLPNNVIGVIAFVVILSQVIRSIWRSIFWVRMYTQTVCSLWSFREILRRRRRAV